MNREFVGVTIGEALPVAKLANQYLTCLQTLIGDSLRPTSIFYYGPLTFDRRRLPQERKAQR